MTSTFELHQNASPILLLGAGHTHLSLLQLAWKEKNRSLLDRILLISEHDFTLYSGMISGWILGEYQLQELNIDLKKTCKKFGVTFLKDKILNIDPIQKTVLTSNKLTISYSVLSINTGLSSSPPEKSHNHILYIRPLNTFIEAIHPILQNFETISHRFKSIKIYGGGASGIEIASCLATKSLSQSQAIPIEILESSEKILNDFSDNFRQQTLSILKNKNIKISLNSSLTLDSLENLDINSLHILCFVPPTSHTHQNDPLLEYRKINPYLQSNNFAEIFCVGDAATPNPSLAHFKKSGAHAVFQSKTLYKNIQNILKNLPLQKYPAQKNEKHLLILNLGNKLAILQKSWIVLRSNFSWKLKCWIDKKYMNQFKTTSIDMVVSAVALVSGGTYQILLQAIDACKTFPQKKFLFLVHSKNNLPQIPNVNYLEYPDANKSYFKRLKTEYLDFYPLSKNINPKIWLSLHDVTPRVKCDTQAVYCHNALPYWKPSLFHWKFHRFEVVRSFLYGFLFKFRASHNDLVISQLPWFANFLSKYIPLPIERFACVRPKLKPPQPSSESNSFFENKSLEKRFHEIKLHYKTILFYPCLPRVFKKIEDAIKLAKHSTETAIIISISGEENSYAKYCKGLALNLPNVFWWGELNHRDCMDILSQSDALFFPSDLESFGLPLQEAIDRNIWILAPKKPWVLEVVENYPKSYIYEDIEDADKFLQSHPLNLRKNPSTTEHKIPRLLGFEALFEKLFEMNEKKSSLGSSEIIN